MTARLGIKSRIVGQHSLAAGTSGLCPADAWSRREAGIIKEGGGRAARVPHGGPCQTYGADPPPQMAVTHTTMLDPRRQPPGRATPRGYDCAASRTSRPFLPKGAKSSSTKPPPFCFGIPYRGHVEEGISPPGERVGRRSTCLFPIPSRPRTSPPPARYCYSEALYGACLGPVCVNSSIPFPNRWHPPRLAPSPIAAPPPRHGLPLGLIHGDTSRSRRTSPPISPDASHLPLIADSDIDRF